MDYKLAKKLKDEGFEYSKATIKQEFKEGIIKIPTLSELTEACGDEYLMLTKAKYSWIADGIDPTDRSTGKTPEEAVAKLWLKLNKK